jgi:hypothetical protein
MNRSFDYMEMCLGIFSMFAIHVWNIRKLEDIESMF